MIYNDIIAGVQTNNEMNISFKFNTLTAIMKSAYDAITDLVLIKKDKQLFHIEDDLPEFARYLECFFPRLKKLKFNNVVTVETLAKIPEIKNAAEYHKYLQEKGYINKKNNLIEDRYFHEKNNELPDNDFFNKLLPLEFLKEQDKNDVKNRFRAGLIVRIFEAYSAESHYRYRHTLNLVKGLLAILNKDYDLFIRLDNKAKNRGENLLTKTQFNYIYNVLDTIISEIVSGKNGQKEKDKFLTLFLGLVVTHDYGIESPDDDAGHQFRSAKLCRPDLEKLNFSKEQISFIELIIENHCYYGDLSLGEGTYNYYQELLMELKQRVFASLSWKKHFLAILWLLNILDINAAAGGYLSKEKMEVIGTLYNAENFEKAIADKNLLKAKVAYLNDNYAGRKIDYKNIDPEFANVYLQHFIGFFNNADREGLAYLKEDEAILLINRIVELFKATRQLNYKFITVKERGELGTKVIHNFIKKISGKGDIVILNEAQGAGLFYGIPFEIKNHSLFIRNDKISY